MKIVCLIVLFSLSILSVNGQAKYFTREGKVKFYSDAPLEKIESLNKKATAVIDASSGNIEFSVLMKAFEFEKALMQEHFNENYVESSKYPKAVFKGIIENNSDVKWGKDGEYKVNVKGKMSFHGEENDLSTPATIFVKNGKVSGNSTFDLVLSDYKIGIPKVVEEKISKSVQVTIDIDLEELKSK